MSIVGMYIANVVERLGPIPPVVPRSLVDSVLSQLNYLWIFLYIVFAILCAISIENLIFRRGKWSERMLFCIVSIVGAAIILWTIPQPIILFKFLECIAFCFVVLLILAMRHTMRAPHEERNAKDKNSR